LRPRRPRGSLMHRPRRSTTPQEEGGTSATAHGHHERRATQTAKATPDASADGSEHAACIEQLRLQRSRNLRPVRKCEATLCTGIWLKPHRAGRYRRLLVCGVAPLQQLSDYSARSPGEALTSVRPHACRSVAITVQGIRRRSALLGGQAVSSGSTDAGWQARSRCRGRRIVPTRRLRARSLAEAV